jgi:ATP-binding cassette subfamily B protein
MPLVMRVAEQAQIDETIKSWRDSFATIVGERGVKFSGGQRQRIGLARALYRRAEILVLDEATSALDGVTQREVIDSLRSIGGNLTVILIAHRLSTLIHCNKIFELVNGEMKLTNSDPSRRAAGLF